MLTVKRLLIAGTILLIVGSALAACGSPTTTTAAPAATEAPAAKPVASKPAKPVADGAAHLSCEHFRNVMGDIGNGLLTDSEIRDKTKQFYDTGSVSDIATIRIATRGMLAAITSGDTDAYISSAKVMDKACSAVGE